MNRQAEKENVMTQADRMAGSSACCRDRGVVLVAVLVLLYGPTGAWAETNISPTSPNYYAWSENAGWLNFRPLAGADGVMVYGECLRGYVWAENIGYINLAAPATTSCGDILDTTQDNYGVTVDGSGNCSGYGWSENAGWVNFNPIGGGVKVTITPGSPPRDFDGYAWGENVGYIHFQNSSPAYKVQQTGPTNVELVSFSARECVRDRCVVLAWETASELDNVGFHIRRSGSHDGEYVRITDKLIEARGDLLHGASYSYTDEDVDSDWNYFYKLEDIDYNDTSTFHGPVSVETSVPGPWGMPTIAEASTVQAGSAIISGGLNIFLLLVPPTAAILLWLRKRKKA